jgi:hypothetical protein
VDACPSIHPSQQAVLCGGAGAGGREGGEEEEGGGGEGDRALPRTLSFQNLRRTLSFEALGPFWDRHVPLIY